MAASVTARSIKIALVLNTAEAAAVLQPFADAIQDDCFAWAASDPNYDHPTDKVIDSGRRATVDRDPEAQAILRLCND